MKYNVCDSNFMFLFCYDNKKFEHLDRKFSLKNNRHFSELLRSF